MDDLLLEAMAGAALAAGVQINRIYARPFTAEEKADGSPLTVADQVSEAVICQSLEPFGLPILGEEGVADGDVPMLGDRYFCVDPLDGTKEFIKRNDEFTVNIALIENGRPTAGVVLAPALGTLYAGDAQGAWRADVVDETAGPRKPIKVATEGPIRIVASRSHGHSALERLMQRLDTAGDVSVGSSLKFCLLATGEARLYPRFTPTCEWDTAAGQAVLEAAGGTVVAIDGTPLRYGHAERNFLNPFFVAASDAVLAERAAAEMRALA